MAEVTQILSQIEQGDLTAAERLLPLVYDELRRLAAVKLAHEKPGQTLQATALVHEAYLRLIGPAEVNWAGRRQFIGAAAEAMRRILVERARARRTVKRGGQMRKLGLESLEISDCPTDKRLLDLDEALSRLAQRDQVKAELVKLRYFVGMTNAEAAAALGIGQSTADKYWAYAKAWLRAEIAENPENE